MSQKPHYARPAAAAAAGARADDVATLSDWLRRDILALAGPSYAERATLYDFVVAELRARVSQYPHRLGPLCTWPPTTATGWT